MKTLMRAFENVFTSAKSTNEESNKDVYREWTKQRNAAAQFGPNHVAEIDAIFSRNGF